MIHGNNTKETKKFWKEPVKNSFLKVLQFIL